MLRKREVPKNLEEFYKHVKPEAPMLAADPERYKQLYISNCLNILHDCVWFKTVEKFELACKKFSIQGKIWFSGDEEPTNVIMNLRSVE